MTGSATLARLLLLLFAGGCIWWLVRLDYGQKISTNILDLIPAEEQSAEVNILRDFARGNQSRVMLFALQMEDGTRPSRMVTRDFSDQLEQSGEFSDVLAWGGDSQWEALGGEIFAHRFDWLLPGWLDERMQEHTRQTGSNGPDFATWLAASTAADLEAFLSRPEAIALHEIVPHDPLLLVPALWNQSGLVEPTTAADRALVWALLRESPLTENGQQPVFDLIAAAAATVAADHPSVTLRWTGVNRFAAASRARIESDIKRLHLLSLAAVLTVCALFVRRLTGILHFAPVIALAIMGAWVFSTLVFAKLHILVFVIGSLLAGVAIDYAVYIFLQPEAYPEEPYRSKLRRLLKPLCTSCLTTVAGFSFLILSDLPLVRQVGFFVASGLLCALGVAILYFAQIKNPFLDSRQFGSLGGGHHPGRWRVAVLLLAVGGLAVGVLGTGRLQWRDDVREMDAPDPTLATNDAEVRRWFGDMPDDSTVFLSHGDSVATARQHLQDFVDVVNRADPDRTIWSPGTLLPTEAHWQALPERLAELADFAPAFRAELEYRGFEAEAFATFFAQWDSFLTQSRPTTYDEVVAEFHHLWRGPLALLQNTDGPYWFLTRLGGGAGDPPPSVAHTVGVNQLESLNGLFARYRASALRLSLIGLGCIIASVFVIYPPRHSSRIAVIPAGACFIVFGAFGIAGLTLNLFHLLGAFLGFCLSHNYAIFSSNRMASHHAPPVAIRLSALSTATAFGVLGFSRIPVIHALGLTVSLIVITALMMVELEPRLRRPQS